MYVMPKWKGYPACRFGFSLLLLALWHGSLVSDQQRPLVFYTEHSPPGEYLDEQGRVAGPTIDLLKHLMTVLNDHGQIHLLPWARSYKEALGSSNSVLFETIRTPERESLFQWVGPLKLYKMGLYKKAGLDIPSQPNKRIACELRGSSYVNVLNELGFKEGVNLILAPKSGHCLKLLQLNRVHLTVLTEAVLFPADTLKDFNLELWQTFGTTEMYFAFSKDVSAERVKQWQRALEQSYLDGTMRKFYTGKYDPAMIERLEEYAKYQSAFPSAGGSGSPK